MAQAICRLVLKNGVRPDSPLTSKQLRWKCDAVIVCVKKLWRDNWMTKGAIELTAFVHGSTRVPFLVPSCEVQPMLPSSTT